jgi:hypothetical protein
VQHGAPAAPPAPPPRPEIDEALLRPRSSWYGVALAIGGVAFVVSSALSAFNTFDNFGGEPSLGISAISWLIYVVGIGAAAAIGGVTWSRRNEHKRRLQREEMIRRGQM